MTMTGAWADRSEQIDLISAAVVQALGELSDLPKTQTANTGKFAYSYATLADALAQARPVLLKHGLAITQTASVAADEVLVYTVILHSSGQFLTSQPIAMPVGQTAQATGSSVTYGRRYSLMAVLGLATEDDDGASASVREARRSPSNSRKPDQATDTVPEPRTAEEAKIRHMLSGIHPSEARKVKASFVEMFGSSLADLDPQLHASALTWVENSIGWDAE